MGRRSRRGRLPEPEQILGGKRVDVATLVTVIHRVNPTDRGLHPAEEARRYALKSALQSVLLREHPDAVEVESAGDDPDLIVIRTLVDGRDAGHARITGLDEDLRPAVRSRLALADVPDEPPAPTAAAVAATRSEAEQALESWDLDRAITLFRDLALGGDVAAARQCMDVHVDLLAALEPARALFAALPRALQGDPAVAVTLAVAEARWGDLGRAAALAGDLRGDRAGEVWEALARDATDPARIAELAHRMERADPSRLQARVELLERARALLDEARAPVRAAVATALSAGDIAAAEAVIRDAGDPPWLGSERDAIARARARETTRRLVDKADRAEAAGQPREAARLLRRAAEVFPELADRAAALERLAQQAQDAARIDALVRSLQAGPTAEDLVRYIGAPDDDRRRIRNAADVNVLAWIEGAPPRLRRRARSLAQAILAIGAARADLAADRPRRARRALEPIRDTVAAIPAGAATLAELRAVLDARRAERIGHELAQARAALDAGDAAGAAAILDAVDDVPDALAADHAALSERAAAIVGAEAQRERFERLLDGPEPWRARDLAEDLLAANPGDRSWELRFHRARAEVRRELQVWAQPGGRRGFFGMGYVANGMPAGVVRHDPLRAVVACCTDGHLELTEVDGFGVPQRTLLLRLAGLASSAGTWISGDSLTLTLGSWLAEVDLVRWEVVRFRHLRGRVDSANPQPGALWLRVQDWGGQNARWTAVDPRTLAPLSKVRAWEAVFRVPGVAGLAVVDWSAAVQEMGAEGRRLVRVLGRAPGGTARACAFALDPGGRGLVVLGVGPAQMELFLTTESVVQPVDSWPRDPTTDRVGWLASDGDLLFVFQLLQGRLVALSPAGRGFRRLWSARVPVDKVVPVQAAEGGPVFLAVTRLDGPGLVRLGPEPPVLDIYDAGPAPLSLDLERCWPALPEPEMEEWLDVMDIDGAEEVCARMLEMGEAVDDVLETALRGLSTEPLPACLEPHAHRIREVPLLRALRGEQLLEAKDWQGIVDLLDGIPRNGLDEPDWQHFQHTLGRALLHLGRRDEAMRAFERGATVDGDCDLAIATAFCELLNRHDTPESLVAARLRAADAAPTPSDVLGELDHPLLHRFLDVQVAARRADAHLALEGELYDRLYAFARLSDAVGRIFDRPWPGEWPQERIEDLSLAVMDAADALDAARPEPCAILRVTPDGDHVVLRPHVAYGEADVSGEHLRWRGATLLRDGRFEESVARWFEEDFGHPEQARLPRAAFDARRPSLADTWDIHGTGTP